MSSEIQAASRQLDCAVDSSKLGELRRSVAARVRQRRRARLAAMLATPVLVLGLAWGWARQHSEAPPLAAATALQQLRVNDGSRIELLSPGARARIVKDTPQDVVVELASGSARFRVRPASARAFTVHTGGFDVRVLGTTFVVAQLTDGIEVQVEAGRVSVQGPQTDATVEAGEVRRFSARLPAPPASAAAVSGDRPVAVAPSSASAARAFPDWRSLAKAKKYEQAYAALAHAGHVPALSADDLLLRADVARLSGHAADAVEPLRSLVERFPSDSRVPSAWFTLASVEEQLGRSSRAAEAFARSRALQPGGPLAEAALGREALALLASGSRAAAETRAREYLKRYPAGMRASEIKRRFGLP